MRTINTTILFLFTSILVCAQFESKHITTQWLKEKNVPILGLGVIENGTLTKVEVFGDIKPDRKAAYNTIFNVASLTKPVTAIVALKLVSQGKLDLDEPLSKYWIDPDIKGDSRTKLLTTRINL